MKNKTLRFTQHIPLLALCILALFLAISCSKSEDSNTGDKTPNGEHILKFKISGIEGDNSVAKSAIGMKGDVGRRHGIQADETLVSGTLGDALISLEQNIKAPLSSSITPNNGDAQAKARGAKAASIPLEDQVKYRVILCDQNDNVLANVVGSTGTDPLIPVNLGWTYKWYAYSNKERESVPDFDTDSKLISRAALSNKDLMVASGNISIQAGENFLNIVFKRKTARIQAVVNVRGMFATLSTDTKISIQNNTVPGTEVMTMGDYNPFSNSFSNIEPVNAVVTNAEMKVDNIVEGEAVKVASFYTLNTTAISPGNLTFNFTPLSILLDDGRTRTFSSSPGLSFTLPQGLTPSIGSSHIATLRLLESPIKVKGIMWARTNLIYNPLKLDKYRLKSNPDGSNITTIDQDFWNWKSDVPRGEAGTTDGCALLYPEGTWKMPDLATWETLGQPDKKEEINGIFYGANYGAVWEKDTEYSRNEAYDDNRLYISYGGYRTAPGFFAPYVDQSPIGFLYGVVAGGQCHYWTATAVNETTSKAVVASFSRVLWGISWGGITYEDRVSDEGRNVRCIRAINNPNR